MLGDPYAPQASPDFMKILNNYVGTGDNSSSQLDSLLGQVSGGYRGSVMTPILSQAYGGMSGTPDPSYLGRMAQLRAISEHRTSTDPSGAINPTPAGPAGLKQSTGAQYQGVPSPIMGQSISGNSPGVTSPSSGAIGRKLRGFSSGNTQQAITEVPVQQSASPASSVPAAATPIGTPASGPIRPQSNLSKVPEGYWNNPIPKPNPKSRQLGMLR